MSAEELRKDVIEEQLISMHVSPTFLGFGYLVSGISICIDDPSYEHNITSRLYPMIAQKHGVTVASFISIIAHKIAHEYRYGNAKEERPIRISDMRDKKDK